MFADKIKTPATYTVFILYHPWPLAHAPIPPHHCPAAVHFHTAPGHKDRGQEGEQAARSNTGSLSWFQVPVDTAPNPCPVITVLYLRGFPGCQIGLWVELDCTREPRRKSKQGSPPPGEDCLQQSHRTYKVPGGWGDCMTPNWGPMLQVARTR